MPVFQKGAEERSGRDVSFERMPGVGSKPGLLHPRCIHKMPCTVLPGCPLGKFFRSGFAEDVAGTGRYNGAVQSSAPLQPITGITSVKSSESCYSWYMTPDVKLPGCGCFREIQPLGANLVPLKFRWFADVQWVRIRHSNACGSSVSEPSPPHSYSHDRPAKPQWPVQVFEPLSQFCWKPSTAALIWLIRSSFVCWAPFPASYGLRTIREHGSV